MIQRLSEHSPRTHSFQSKRQQSLLLLYPIVVLAVSSNKLLFSNNQADTVNLTKL
jgi:hypothetical protein